MTQPNRCSDCSAESSSLSRRRFVQAAGAVAATGALPRFGQAAPTASSAAETTAKEFYSTLSEAQRTKICFPFDHPLRSRISANWAITEPDISDKFYSDAQRDLIQRVIKSITSEDGYERLIKQMDDDAGGWDAYHVALFGSPDSGKFQFELTGRHLTLRADGDSVSNYAFGGPIVYGHGEEDPKQNLYHYQTKQANEVFAALDEPQRKKALLSKAPGESQVPLQGANGKFAGLMVSEMSDDQKELVEKTIQVMLAPYRQEDVDEVRAVLKETGGLDKLHMAFYQQGDLNNDKVWDVWRVEGPSLVWHFRGAPHVHTYLNIGVKS